MLNENGGLVKQVLSVLLFPTFFQEAFIKFGWGAADHFWLLLGKRVFLLLPILAFILACWLSIACLLTVLVRQNRREFINGVFISWWDLGKSVLSFWGGIFKFVLNLSWAILGFIKIVLLGIWSLIQEIVLMPFRLLGTSARSIVSSTVPWIAVSLTLFWCLIEATIFTYVTTPLVVDTFSNITGTNLSETVVRIPLFVFLLFIVLGSYAVLSNFMDAAKSKSIPSMLGIGAIEIVVLFVEVIFLYREFVDSLVPWFAQYSENFELGIFWTLAISCFVWFGIRSLSWFLFAAHGTPIILAVIQGRGLALVERRQQPKTPYRAVSTGFIEKLKSEKAWIQQTGEQLLASFILPPLQVVAAAINFCTLLVSSEHMFELPLESLETVKPRWSGLQPTVVSGNSTKTKGSVRVIKKDIGDFQNV